MDSGSVVIVGTGGAFVPMRSRAPSGSSGMSSALRAAASAPMRGCMTTSSSVGLSRSILCEAPPVPTWRGDFGSCGQQTLLFDDSNRHEVPPTAACDAAAALLALAMQPVTGMEDVSRAGSSDRPDSSASDLIQNSKLSKRSLDEAALYSPLKQPEQYGELARLTKRMKVNVREPGAVARVDETFRRALTYSF
eukprot:c41387_g1_i1.p1 GENE.c41387_g1_i1~~c41387_g1_i1.p1  ORF type:complete len:210 (+),score=25.51 c41387_g1_i1:54-632(+)